MKTNIFLLCVLMFSSLTFAQDIGSLLNPSLRALENFHDASNPMSCFDYSTTNPTIAETQKGPNCANNGFQDVPVGKFREMTRNGYRSGNYILSRPSANKFQAILNMQFVPDASPPVGSAGNAALAQQMLQRTRNCLNEMKPFLKGPNGEELEFVLVDSSSVMPDRMPKPRPTQVKVSQQAPGYRGDAGNFGSNFECQTIGHEMLHHLGLCDEYHEGIVQQPGHPNADWSCRPVTATPSYMRNMHYAFQTTLPLTARCECNETCQAIMRQGGKAKDIYLSMNGNEILNSESSLVAQNTAVNPDRQLCRITGNDNLPYGTEPAKAFEFDSQTGTSFKFNSYRVNGIVGTNVSYNKLVYTCTCPPDRAYCNKLIDQLKSTANNIPKRVTCPDGLNANSTGPSIGTDPAGSRVSDCRTSGGKQVCDLVLTTPGSGKSLLSPSHFYRMIGGNCQGSAPNYEQCEQYAYIGKNTPACNNMPAQCLDDNYYLNQTRALTGAQASSH